MDAQATAGKIHVGGIYSEKKADKDAATDVALQGFEDGLFRVIHNETEITALPAPMQLQDGDTVYKTDLFGGKIMVGGKK
jgi:hypothetical protein